MVGSPDLLHDWYMPCEHHPIVQLESFYKPRQSSSRRPISIQSSTPTSRCPRRMCQRLQQDVLSFGGRIQPGNAGKTQFAVHVDWRPGWWRGVVHNVERITNDLRILNFTSKMDLGNPLICERNEITAKSCRQYLSISGGEFIARPP